MGDYYNQKPWLKFYDKHVPANLQFPDKPFWEFIEPAFSKFSDRVAFYYMGSSITFKQLDEMSNRFANLLKKIGLKKGDVVGIHLPNLPAYYISLVGAAKAGCVFSGVSPLLTAEELNNQLKDSGAKVLVTLDVFYPRVVEGTAGTQLKAVVVTGIADYLPPIKAVLGKMLKKIPIGEVLPLPGIDIYRIKEVMKNLPATPVAEKVGMDVICIMQYTGGTTGLPKGAQLTQRNTVAMVAQLITWLDTKSGNDVGMSAFPLFHISGLAFGLLLLSTANSQIAVPNPRDQKLLMAAFKKYKPNIVANVPTVYLELMKMPEFRALDFSMVKYFASGGAPYPPEYIKEFEKVVGEGKLIEIYGLTETGPLTMPPRFGKKKPNTTGIPFPGIEFKIVDPETGDPVPFNEPGEIAVKGPQVSVGYFKKQDETSLALRDGWFHTGDVARMDEEGFITIVDRLKDMVNVSGYKVFTRELDDVIMEHPDVFMGASIGIPNPERPGTEIVATAIVLNQGIEKSEAEKTKILEYLKVKVAPYKVPKKLEFLDELPLSAVGKVLKRELKVKFKS